MNQTFVKSNQVMVGHSYVIKSTRRNPSIFHEDEMNKIILFMVD